MSETTDSGRQEIERSILQRSLEDEPFRQRLLAAPDTIYLGLPSNPPIGGELPDEELEAVAGGRDPMFVYTSGAPRRAVARRERRATSSGGRRTTQKLWR